MNCSICGTANSDGADFCRHCGVSIMHAATAPPAARAGRCPRCGGDCALPARFCDRCGIRMAPQPGTAGRETVRSPNVAAPMRERLADAVFRTPAMTPIVAPAAVVAAPDDIAPSEAAEAVEDGMTGKQETDDERRPGGARRRAVLAAGAAAALAGVCVSGYWLADALLFGRSPWSSPAPPVVQIATAQPVALAGTDPAAAVPPIAAVSSVPTAPTSSTASTASIASPVPQSSLSFSLPSEAALPLADSPEEARATSAPTASAAPAKPAAPRLAARKTADAPASSGDGASSNAMSGAGSHEATVVRREAEPIETGERAAPRAVPKVASVSWHAALRAQLAECGRDPNLFGRIVCRERAKFRYCGPDHWGKAEECVQTRRRDPFTIDASG